MSDTSTIDQLKDRLDIVDLIGETVTLTDCGGGIYKGAISSSNQSGQSLDVNRTEQLYNDFAGVEGGDVFNWIAYVNNLDINKDFSRILQIAADKAGVTPEPGNPYTGLNALRDFLTAAAEWYHSKLTTEHRIFIKDTWGLSDETIDQYKIGYDPVGDKAELQRALNGGL